MVSSVVRLRFVDLASQLSHETVSHEILEANAPKVLKRYPSFEAWPADAQLGFCLVSWVIGPGFHIAAFKDAVARPVPDFSLAAESCAVPERGHPGALALNSWVKRMFQNAGRVLDLELSPKWIYFPMDLSLVVR